MSEPARHLRIVTEHGELLDQHPDIQRLEDEVKGLQRALRKEILAHENLKRDKAKEARKHEAWHMAEDAFGAWKAATGHSRSKWKPDRFWMIEPWLMDPAYGLEICLQAIAGIAFDPYKTEQKNGAWERHDSWELCFRDTDRVERYANKAPRRWREASMFAEVLERYAPNATAPHPKARRNP